VSSAQEDCFNGIDDDGDGLIDIQDIVDCYCGITFYQTFNGDFEDYWCCPANVTNTNDGINCLDDGWGIVSGSPDYFNTCGYLGGFSGEPFVPLPIPSGEGVVGFITESSFPYYETVGVCLEASLIPGETYTFSFYLGFNDNGVDYNSGLMVDVVLFGSESCDGYPVNPLNCLDNNPNWIPQTEVYVEGLEQDSWKYAETTFVATSSIEAIAIGLECSTEGAQYHFLDDVKISGNFRIPTIGDNIEITGDCVSGVTLEVPNVAGATYQWYLNGIAISGATSNPYVISNAADGDYTVVVTTSSGCALSPEIPVIIDTDLVEVTGVVTDILCTNEDEGAINISTNSNNNPIMYNWSNASTAEDLINVAPGSYTVTVTDDYGCTGSANFIVNEPDPIEIEFYGNCSDGFFLLVPDSLPGATYYWYYEGNLIAEGPQNPYQIENIDNNGYYYVYLDDGLNCLQSSPIVVFMDPLDLQLSGEVVNIECFGSETGSIDLNVDNIFVDYTLVWSSGQTDEDIENLAAGQYEVTVTSEFGCIGVMIFDIDQPDSLSNELEVTQPNEGNLGSAGVSTSGGTMPYEYLWNTGNTNSFDNGLLPGSYTITITDANDCKDTLEFVIESNFFVDVMVFPGSCPGMCEDSLVVSIVGPELDYTIEWDDENLIGFFPNNLCAGTYNYIVTDESGAQTAGYVIIEEGEGLSLSGTFDSLLCIGSTTDITLSIENGLAPYTIVWNTLSNNYTLFQVPAGDYFVTVTDNSGCSATDQYSILSLPEIMVDLFSTPAGCIGEATGSIDLTISGGASPYETLWSTGDTSQNLSNLAIGEYSYVLQDSFSCTYMDTLMIEYFEESTFLVLGVNCDEDNLAYSVEYSIDGDSYPYNINGQVINDGETSDLMAFSGDSLIIHVIDANSCVIYDETVFYACDCESEIGTMNSDLVEVCNDETLSVLPIVGNVLAESDSLVYVLHSSADTIIADILFVSSSAEGFNFDPVSMTVNTVYYISAVVFSGNEFNIFSLEEACTQISFGTPVLWASKNTLELPGLLEFCEFDQVEFDLNYSGVVPITIFIYDDFGDSYSLEITKEGQNTFSITLEESTEFIVDFFVPLLCPLEIIGELEIEINDPPYVWFGPDIFACNSSSYGSIANLDDLITSSNTSGIWQDDQGNVVSNIVDFDGFLPGDYYFEYFTIENEPCDEISYVVRVIVEECDCPMDLFLPFEGLCQGEYLIDLNEYLNPSFVDLGSWSVSTINGTEDLGLLGSDLLIEEANVGKYQLIYTLDDVPQDCNAEYTFDIEIRAILSSGSVLNLETIEFCIGDLFEIILFDYLEDYDVGGEWASQDGIPIDILTGLIDLSFADGGLYTFDYEIPENEYCPASTTEVSILIHDPIDLYLSILDPLCFGLNDGSVNVEAINDSPIEFNLFNGDLEAISNPDSLFAGEYELTVIDENGCVRVENFTLIDPLELFLDLGEDRIVEEGEVTLISPVINFEGDNISLFQWFANQANVETPVFDTLIISPAGETNIQLIITDDDGCIVADDLLLSVINNDVLVILANVFNPLNSTFGIESFMDISIVNKFSIYDRWGSLIFEKKEFVPDDQSKRWDGTLNGSLVENGVYVYSIYYTNQQGARISIYGDVAVVR
jgi:hypothetical protein